MISVELPKWPGADERSAARAVESSRHKEPAQDGAEATKNRSGFVQSFCLGRPFRTGNGEPNRPRSRLNHAYATFLSSGALSHISRRRIAVVGNGNIDVGSKTSTRESGQPIVERLVRNGGFPDLRIDHQNPSRHEPARKCGAMSEQSADSGRGNEQVRQKLVHLVGYRDPNARPDPWVRPRPIPVKR
jgi:hypothetical protein